MPPPVTHDGIAKADWLIEKEKEGVRIVQQDWEEFMEFRAWKQANQRKPLLQGEVKDGNEAAPEKPKSDS